MTVDELLAEHTAPWPRSPTSYVPSSSTRFPTPSSGSTWQGDDWRVDEQHR